MMSFYGMQLSVREVLDLLSHAFERRRAEKDPNGMLALSELRMDVVEKAACASASRPQPDRPLFLDVGDGLRIAPDCIQSIRLRRADVGIDGPGWKVTTVSKAGDYGAKVFPTLEGAEAFVKTLQNVSL